MRRSHVDRDRDQRGIHDEGSAIAIAIPALDPHRDGRGVRPAIAIAMADRDEKAAVSGKSHRDRPSRSRIVNGFWDVWNEPVIRRHEAWSSPLAATLHSSAHT